MYILHNLHILITPLFFLVLFVLPTYSLQEKKRNENKIHPTHVVLNISNDINSTHNCTYNYNRLQIKLVFFLCSHCHQQVVFVMHILYVQISFFENYFKIDNGIAGAPMNKNISPKAKRETKKQWSPDTLLPDPD